MERFEFPIAGPEAYAADPCVPVDTETPRLTTEDGVEYVRTPDSAFDNLDGYPFEPNYATVEGMRMHYIDAGDSDAQEVVLMLHGQPSWSYLYRKMVPVLVERGYRVICPDWLGMGRSDKPTGLEQHTYAKQVSRLKDFIKEVIPEALETDTITLFVQDWGSLIGLRTVADEPSWFRRVVSANGNLPVLPPTVNPYVAPFPVNYNCSDTRNHLQMIMDRVAGARGQKCGLDQGCFSIWINYALTAPLFQASGLLQIASSATLTEDELAAYDAPFPSHIYKAGIRTFPSMMAGVYEPEFGNIEAWEKLQHFSRPYLALSGENDPSLGSEAVQSNQYENIVGAKIHTFEHRRYPGAGHFIQEDVGAEMAAYVADFIDGTADLVLEAPPLEATTSGSIALLSPEGTVSWVFLLPLLLALNKIW